MTTPPAKLIELLPAEGLIELRRVDGTLEHSISMSDAVAHAIRGEIEGVGTRSGHLRYVRWLPESARPPALEVPLSEVDEGRSTAFATTNLGAYKQAVREVFVQDFYGFRTATGSGDVVGHVWAHCRPSALVNCHPRGTDAA